MKSTMLFIVLFGLVLIPNSAAYAHCDTMNGPVVIAAGKALETGDVNLVLVWVQKHDEQLIRDSFAKTLAVRKLGPDAKVLADLYFYETVVRIHRAGEGVAYTGLKPAETKVEHGIEAADKALESGSVSKLLMHLNESIHNGIHRQFTDAKTKMNYESNDVNAGREYVQAYVTFIHYAERLFQAAEITSDGNIHRDQKEGTQEHMH